MLNENQILGVPIRQFAIGALILCIVIVMFIVGNLIVYSSSVTASIAQVWMVEQTLNSKLQEQEQTLIAKLQEQTKSTTTQAQTQANQLATRLDTQGRDITALNTELSKANNLIAGLRIERNNLQTQVLLLKAAGRVTRAARYLNDNNPGLARRDLAIAIDALDQAKATASDDKKIALEEIRIGLAELRQSIEAKSYPIATLEILADKIEDLVGK